MQVARNTTAYLTVLLHTHDKRTTNLPQTLHVPKEVFVQEHRLPPKSWDYLVPVSESFSIMKEPLPWVIPKEFGRGLDGGPHQHVAGIPARALTESY